VVLAMAPVLDEKGNVVGMLASSIDIERSRIGTFGETISVGTTGYLEIVDGNGIVLARTEPGSPPTSFEKSDHPGRFSELIKEGKATVRTCHRCHETKQELQRRRDVLAFAPLATASWGVAIRQSEEEALAPTRLLESRLFLLGTLVLLFTAFLVWFVTQGIVKPIRELTTAAKRVATGNFKAVTPLARRDEIGQLTAAFYAMTQELAISRDELMSRNEELSALNSIATTVSQSLDLKNVLENALLKVLEVTRATTGCVFLREANSDKLVMMKCVGSSDVFQCGQYGSMASCACHQVLHSGQMLMVKDISQCPVLGKENVDCFVCLPLKSKGRALGIINMACSGERSFTESDFKLLDSIGHHVGLAIENSILYKDAKEKEQIRGQLLSRAIGAQEEERKRIARELHDEYGQTLTGLVMSIESLEVITPSTETRVREKLQHAKALVSRALDDIRKLTLDLRPSTLDNLGLVSTVRSYAQNHLEAQGIHVDFRSKGLRTRLAPPIEIALFRIIQEAIHNIIKYAVAHNVKIQLEAKDGKITAIVEDDGKGFDVEAVLKNKMERQSLGLLGIEERAGLLGGTFSIESQGGKGTRLTVQIPFEPLEKQDLALNRLG
jgi:signal transduction histidine kinase